VVIAALLAVFLIVSYIFLTLPNFVTLSSSKGITFSAAAEASGKRIYNVALFGIDARSDVEGARSDSMMIVSSDNKHKKIKATSLMRDTYVSIPGHGYGKLNSAYAYGGPSLAVKAINTNFDTAITDYIVINFNGTIAMVNAVGGVNVTLSSDEVSVLNDYVDNINRTNGTNAKHVTGSGSKHLNGVQALAYSRIRYVGNGDFGRTQRQRTVMQKVIKKGEKMSLIKQYKLYKTMKPYIKTNMSNFKMFKFIFNLALIHNSKLQQQQIPDANALNLGYLQGQSYIFPTSLSDNVQTLHKFIYEHSYTPSEKCQEISDHIDSVWQ
jgi:LCP family protein required for cell wall assembly